MKTLFPKQQQAHDFFKTQHLAGKSTLDTSSVGTGKTIVACHLAKTLNRPVAVICPKAVIPSWQREMAECGLEPLFVMNYEQLRTGKTQWVTLHGKKTYKWHLPEDTLVLIDECHKAKGPYTKNAQIVVALISAGFKVHMMSATAAEDPTEMRATGYALGLHGLNKPEANLKSWFGWMISNGCQQNPWGAWEFIRKSKLKELNQIMYQSNVYRLTVSDFPDSFRENRVFVEPVEFTNLKKIAKAYEDLGITPEIVTQYIENGTVMDSDHVLVNILRARQLAESFKVNDLAEMARDLVSEGNSVVLFVNFRESAEALAAALDCKMIVGGQSAAERQKAIDDFQADDDVVLVVNISAGGTGISLHDINGERQRVSLISPTFNVKDHLQALGRIHRNGAKSDALQKILVANGTIEEVVMKAVAEKTQKLNDLWNQ